MIKERLFLRAQARCSNFERLRRLRLFLDCPTELPARGLFDSQSKAVLLDLSRLPLPGLKSVNQAIFRVSFHDLDEWFTGIGRLPCLANRGARHRLVKADFFSPISISIP